MTSGNEIHGTVYAVLEDTDNTAMVSLQKDDLILIPASPKWVVQPTDSNPTSAMRLVAYKINGGKLVPTIIYRSAFSRKDRKTGKASFANDVVKAMDAGHVAFNQAFAGKVLKVKSVKTVGAWDYAIGGAPLMNEDGTRKVIDKDAYEWEVTNDPKLAKVKEAKPDTDAYNAFITANFGC